MDSERIGEERGLPYVMSADKGEGVHEMQHIADKHYRFCGQRGGGGQEITKVCGRHMWKPPEER